MNFSAKRPLLCICSCFVFPFFAISMISESKRLLASALLISALLLIILFMVIYMAYIRRKNRFSAGISALSAICAFIFVLSAALPLFIFNQRSAADSKYIGKDARVKAEVIKVLSITEWHTSFLIYTGSIDGVGEELGVLVNADRRLDIKQNDIIIADIRLMPTDELLYSENYLQRHRINLEGEILQDGVFAVMGEHSDIFTRFAFVRRNIGYTLGTQLMSAPSALSKALLLGDDDDIPDILNRDFRRIGLLHIIALSGTHLAFITFFLSILLKPIIRNRRLQELIEIFLIIFYLLLAGFPSSLLRAGVMLIICKLARILKHPPDLLTALFLTVTILLILDPYAIFDIGLMLSFAATFGIVLLYPHLAELKSEYFHRHYTQAAIRVAASFVYDGICLSFCACAFTNIVMILIFDSFSLAGILSTFVMSPVITVYMGLSVGILVFGWIPILGDILPMITEKLYIVTERLVSNMSEPEFVEVSSYRIDFVTPFAFLSVFFVFAVIFNMYKGRFIAVMIAVQLSLIPVSIITNISNFDRLSSDHYLFNGNEAFVISRGSDTTLIDISSGNTVLSWKYSHLICKSGYTDIDTLVFTHYHNSHSALLKQINYSIPVRKVLIPKPLSERELDCSLDIEDIAEQYGIGVGYFESNGDVLDLSGHELEFLPMKRSAPDSHARIAFSLSSDQGKTVYLAGVGEMDMDSNVKRLVTSAENVIIGEHSYLLK